MPPQLCAHVLEFTPGNERAAYLRLWVGGGTVTVPTSQAAAQRSRPPWAPSLAFGMTITSSLLRW